MPRRTTASDVRVDAPSGQDVDAGAHGTYMPIEVGRELVDEELKRWETLLDRLK